MPPSDVDPEVSIASQPIDLADPAFEPTDEQLAGLVTRAFSGVKAAHDAAMARLRTEIAEEREKALAKFAAQLAEVADGK
jgi:hypothetical protein